MAALAISVGVLVVAVFGATCRMLFDAIVRESPVWDEVDRELGARAWTPGYLDVRRLDPDDFGFVEWQG